MRTVQYNRSRKFHATNRIRISVQTFHTSPQSIAQCSFASHLFDKHRLRAQEAWHFQAFKCHKSVWIYSPQPTEALLLRSRRLSSIKSTFPQAHTDTLSLPVYHPPRSGFISYLPRSWIPYAELARLDKPTGTYYLFFPCLFSTFMAGSFTDAAPSQVLTTSLLFLTGAFIMRGAGCTVNDLWDRNLDPYVARTRYRPIARGAIPPHSALIFAGVQMLAGLGLLLQLPISCLYYGIPSLLLVATYPLAKRVTHYPQFVLGLTFSWGAIMGFPALGVDLLADSEALKAVGLLYTSCIAWTVLYDMIYAHMDIKDDAKAGIKSIALRHGSKTKSVLAALAAAHVTLLAAAGSTVGAGPVFFLGSCGSAAVTLTLMIWRVRLKEVDNCWWWFKNGAWFTGGGIATGLLLDYYLKLPQPMIQFSGSSSEKGPIEVD
jgi:4-hydroxybenzoate polyprenyltransferase